MYLGKLHLWQPLGEVRSGRLDILAGLALAQIQVLREILLRHAEVLIFKLFDPAFKSSVLVSELDELLIHFINRSNLRRDILQ